MHQIDLLRRCGAEADRQNRDDDFRTRPDELTSYLRIEERELEAGGLN
jgi:hypothetical protein